MTAGETITNIRSQKSGITRPDDYRNHHCAHGALAVSDRVISYTWITLLKNMLMYEPLVPWMCLCLEVIKVDLNSVWPYTYKNGNLDTGMWTREYGIWRLGLRYFNQRSIQTCQQATRWRKVSAIFPCTILRRKQPQRHLGFRFLAAGEGQRAVCKSLVCNWMSG